MSGKWTWLVYMAGDNNLEGAAQGDLAEMAQVGSQGDLNILVQLDTEQKKTYRYRIEKGKYVQLASASGINTGDPTQLTAFINWAVKTAPADNYALVVWNHGGGFEDGQFDYNAMRSMRAADVARTVKLHRSLFRSTKDTLFTQDSNSRAIAIDCGSRDYLDNQELRTAVEKSGVKFQFFGCDACLMNMLEIAYEMRNTAAVMVGSEESEPGAGWPYAEIFSKLTQHSSMSGAELAKVTVSSYVDYFKKHPNGAVTLSAVNLKEIAPVAKLVDQLGTELAKTMASSHLAVGTAARGALTFDTPDYVDLGDFARRLSKYLPQGDTAIAGANAVVGALATSAKFLLAKGHRGVAMARATGVSVFFPSPKSGVDPQAMLADYNRLQIVRDYPGWSQMIASYLKYAVD